MMAAMALMVAVLRSSQHLAAGASTFQTLARRVAGISRRKMPAAVFRMMFVVPDLMI